MQHGPAYWHFPRPALAASFVRQAEAGIQTLTLFAARGTGKTEFVKRDLIPAAEQAGYRAIYCDLWSHAGNPIAALISELQRAVEGRAVHAAVPSLLDRARRLGRRDVKRVEGNAETQGFRIGGAIELNPERAPIHDEIAKLNALFERLMEGSKTPVYLVLDEVQSLADARYEDVVKALRAAFQRYDDRIVRVFTGSSRAGLDRMFHRSRAALFQQGGTRTRFPALDKGFVLHIAQRYEAHTGADDFDAEAAWNGFVSMRHSARLFREALNRVLTADSPNIAHACAAVLARPDADRDQLARWEALAATDQAVLLFLLSEGERPFAVASRKGIGELLKRPGPVEAWEVQNALDRLETQHLVYRDERGVYAIEDEEFRVWLEYRQDDPAEPENRLPGAQSEAIPQAGTPRRDRP